MGALVCLIRELGKLRSTQRVDQSKDWPLQSQLRIDFGLRLLLAEFEALEFSGGGLGEFGEELDPAGALVAADALGDKILHFAGQLFAGRKFFFQDDVGGGLGEARFIVAGDDGGFEHSGVREQGAFDFSGA